MTNPRSLWGSRFHEPLSEIALRFSSSIELDREFYREDIAGSIAHVEMLSACRILTSEEARRLRSALKAIEKEIDTGKLDLSWEKEDIHMAVEQRLIQKVGALGGKLHTGRSRNDQVALDERLYLRGAIQEMRKLTTQIERVLLYKAERYFGAIIPGYTHLQRAQPVLFSHHLLAYVAMLDRDFDRFADCFKRLNRLPLGAAALAGTSLPIDRRIVARKLGFDGVIENSIDAVSDRDYLIEFLSVCSQTMLHLSRLAEEIVLWSSQEFAFAETDDAYTTGSSIMPQKKNPDMAELLRGKAGRLFGHLMNVLTTMKGLPLSYNRDMQEDKQPMFDAVRTTRQSLFMTAHLLVHTRFKPARFAEELSTGFLTATDMAEYLVTKDVPFRDAHEATGKAVAFAIEHHRSLSGLTLAEFRHFSHAIDEDIYEVLDPLHSVEQKRSAGSTSPNEVKKQIVHWTRALRNRRS